MYLIVTILDLAVLDTGGFTLGILLRVVGFVVFEEVLVRPVFVVEVLVVVVVMGVLRTETAFLCCVPEIVDLVTGLPVTFFLLSFFAEEEEEAEDASFKSKFWNQSVSRCALSGLELP